jgi:hypothetical protein
VNVRVGLDPTLRPGYVQSWNLTIERQVRGLVVRGAYVGSKGTHLGDMYIFNPAIYIPGTNAQGQPLSTLANTTNGVLMIRVSSGTSPSGDLSAILLITPWSGACVAMCRSICY